MSVELHPRRLTRVCWAVAALVVVVFGVIAVLLPRGDSAAGRAGIGDQVSFFVLGLMLAGASWAQLELHDDETVPLLAVQSNDGEAAVEAVLALRALLEDARDHPA
jgi:hypothetical protein